MPVRHPALEVAEFEVELVVFDPRVNRVHHLRDLGAAVFDACDGVTPMADLVAEIDRDELWGDTGARSVAALVAWKTGSSRSNAEAIATVAHRSESFPRCVQGMREGRLSLDQIGVIASRAGEGSDEHYAELAGVATVSQLRTAIKLEPRPEPDPAPDAPYAGGPLPLPGGTIADYPNFFDLDGHDADVDLHDFAAFVRAIGMR